MLKSYIMALVLAVTATFVSCTSDDGEWYRDVSNSNVNRNSTADVPEAGRMEFPKLRGGSHNLVIVHYTDGYGINYAVEWDGGKRAQRWTCYSMYNANSVTNWNRNNWRGAYWNGRTWSGDPFQEDPDLPNVYRTTLADYKGTGYNRGHICPSADRLCSMETNGQTFYLSNMHPQYGAFNSGLWLMMENQLRAWNRSSFRDTLYVCKGGTIEDFDETHGVLTHTNSGLIVPRYFFMAVLCKRGGAYKAIGFWAEHLNADHSTDKLSLYVVSIDELEKKTGIDFFCNLPDDVENRIESLDNSSIIRAWGLQ